MPRQARSQWDFSGELFSAEAMRRVFSVTELTVEIRRLIEKQIGQIWVSGEITNFRQQSSGHIYFTLKDANAQLACVLFRNDPVANRESLQDGRKVVLKGDMTVYEARGQHQLHVLAIEMQGLGALQAAFEKLKQKLNAEGLFASERKRPLPRCPERIGLVTSLSGAAIQDIAHVVSRRNPSLEIVVAPCLVQGAGAANEIANAIRLLNEWSERSATKLALILISRGGGSLEDLWAFNEEAVARAIFNSALPVVSAIGHEIDFTISDFVADLRAATPSVAAEILTEGVFSSVRWMAQVQARLRERVRQRMAQEQAAHRQLIQRLQRSHPRRRLNEKLQQLDDLQSGLGRCAGHDLRRMQLAWRTLSERLGRVRPALLLAQRKDRLTQAREQLHQGAFHRMQNLRHRLSGLETRLHLLGPEQVLARGYSITLDAKSGSVLRKAEDARQGQKLTTLLQSGEVQSVVDSGR